MLAGLGIGLFAGCNEALDIETPRSASAVGGTTNAGCFASVVKPSSSLFGRSFDIDEVIAARTASRATPSGACWLSAASWENVLRVSVFALM